MLNFVSIDFYGFRDLTQIARNLNEVEIQSFFGLKQNNDFDMQCIDVMQRNAGAGCITSIIFAADRESIVKHKFLESQK